MDSFLSMLDSIPEDSIAVTVYLLGSLLILWCWYSIATRLPKLLGGITWMMIFAILLTPTVSEGANSSDCTGYFWLAFRCVNERISTHLVKFVTDSLCHGCGACDRFLLVKICG